MRAILVMMLCWLQIVIVQADDERIWFKATLNSHPAHLIFDTGAPAYYTLFRNSAERLGITITNVTDPEVMSNGYTGYTPESSLEIDGETTKVWFWVMDLPSPLTNTFSADGLIGWPTVTNYLIKIDAEAGTMLPFWHVPHDTTGWLQLPLQTGAPNFRLVIPKSNGRKSVLAIDTGGPEGIALRPDLWREWKSSHTNQPTTLRTVYMFGSGLTVHEETWAKEISFGSLKITDVAITEATSDDIAAGGEGYEATLGFAALKRMDLIVDDPHGMAYLRPKTEKPAPYKHNRLAVSFLPPDFKSTICIAHVLTNGPGYVAGIRDGDILLRVNGREIADLGDAASIGEKLEAMRSGTKVTLTLKRGSKVFETSAMLNDILKP